MRKFLLNSGAFIFALLILSVSLFRSASVAYVFATPTPPATPVLGAKSIDIDYQFPFPGEIQPDSSLWTLKVVRDRIWYLVSFNSLKKAELALLFSDKRLLSGVYLFENKKPDIGFSVLGKGEKYLEIAAREEEKARLGGIDTSEFLIKLANASLKHREIIEESILPISPEDARAEIVKIEDYSKNAYKTSRDALNSLGKIPPKDPFDGQ